MRATVPSRKFVTQTAPAPTATRTGLPPTLIGRPTIRFVRGSIRIRVSFYWFATQT